LPSLTQLRLLRIADVPHAEPESSQVEPELSQVEPEAPMTAHITSHLSPHFYLDPSRFTTRDAQPSGKRPPKSDIYGCSTFWIGPKACKSFLGWGTVFVTSQTMAREVALKLSKTPPSVEDDILINIILNVYDVIDEAVGSAVMRKALDPSLSSNHIDVP
jgi:hypothetical protein